MLFLLPILVKMPDFSLFFDQAISKPAEIPVYKINFSLISTGMNQSTTAEIEDIERDQTRVLVVDDLEVNRNLLTKQLGRRGYTVLEADSGPSALEMIENEKFDIVLLDIRMPDMDGLEVLRRIRKTHSPLNLPVIMVTAEALTEVTVEALQSGANDYLVKPIDITAAVARIESQLNLSHMATIKDDIIRFASHDLKKPLIIMMDIAEVLKEDIQSGKPLPDDTADMMDVLIKTGNNMQDIISGFLDQEVLRQGMEDRDYQPLDINNIVQASVISNYDYAGRKAIDLKYTLEPELPKIAANEFRLLQIMDNLIGNAMKYCPQGSVVEVITRREEKNVFVEIKDNGPGLQEEDFPKLFIKHAMLSNQPTGNEISTGVGLALCKQLIKLDKGDIGARNNPDAGVTFWVSLPIN